MPSSRSRAGRAGEAQPKTAAPQRRQQCQRLEPTHRSLLSRTNATASARRRLLACIGRIYAVSFAPVRATSASHPGRSWHRPGEPHAPREGMLEPDAGSRRHHAAGRHGLRRRQPRRREENVYDSEDAADVAFEPSCASALRAYRASHARRIVSAPPSATLRAHANQAPKNPAKTSRSHPPFPHACRHRTIHQPPLARPALLSSTCLSSTSQSPPLSVLNSTAPHPTLPSPTASCAGPAQAANPLFIESRAWTRNPHLNP
jgi:hypothetical protein